MSYAVLDLETSIKNRGENAIGKNKSSPYHTGNDICYLGVLADDEIGTWRGAIDYKPLAKLLVGQNLKFDLLYMMSRYPSFKAWMKEGSIWCTQLAEYILSGQTELWAKLGDTKIKTKKEAERTGLPIGTITKQGLATKYGGEDKDDRLAEFWDNNVDTEDIDPDIVIPYLEGDLKNTEIVFLAQVKEAKKRGILNLMKTQMDALLATTEMEFNGMEFDKLTCLLDAHDLRGTRDRLELELQQQMYDLCDHQIPYEKVSVGSAKQVSAVLFGGYLPVTVAVPQNNPDGTPIIYKSGAKKGQVKTKNERVEKRVAGFGAWADPRWETKKAGVYKVDDKTLSLLKAGVVSAVPSQFTDFIADLQEWRMINKDLTTYYEGYSSLVWPDGKIHPQYNHCATATGRLSHSAPNLGNVSHDKE